MSKRCIAIVGKRHAPDGPRRCNHDTARGDYCHQHLKEKQGLRIMKVPHAKLGLVTVKPIHKDDKIASFNDGVAQYAQPSIRSNAKVVKDYLKSTKDINKNSEVTIPAAGKATKPLKSKMKLIKPIHMDLPPSPKPRKPRVLKPKQPKLPSISLKPLPKTADERSIASLLNRLDVLRKLWNDQRMAGVLKVPITKRDIKLPPTGPKQLGQLMKLFRTERQAWVAHVNKGPYKMTDEKAMALIDKMIK